ncbi:MAG: sigma-54 dependent transcriptional regulator [Planctomycetota bacterium]|jgi:DNA-binding NtrC family response regulator|nr:sigma-54 dependent transcriptional regulator [Planctomycetota bacterium]
MVNMPGSGDHPSATRLLLIDSDVEGARHLARALEARGHSVEVCAGTRRLERLLRSEAWDAILCDPQVVPMQRIAPLLERPGAPAVILLAGFGSIQDAVEAMDMGASNYLSRPVSDEQVASALARALESRDLRAENRRLKAQVGERFELDNLHSRHPSMAGVFELLRSVADTRATILIEGESGTGKTLLARAVHRHSSRAEAPFVEVNCGALPDTLLESELFGHARGAFTGAARERKGKFEAAHTGTLFLDEIACASLDLQVKLLRVLQDREYERVGDDRTRKVDVRIIAATNTDLERAVAEGRFRRDLYYRIRVLHVEVPPLRERPSDVPLLAAEFCERLSAEHDRALEGIDPDALVLLCAHDWPGNVRELQNGIERAVLLARGERIHSRDLPPEVGSRATGASGATPDPGPPETPTTLREAVEATERAVLLACLRRHRGSRKHAASELGVNRTTLFNKMRKHGLMDTVFGAPHEGTAPPA